MDMKRLEMDVRSMKMRCKAACDKPGDPLARQLDDALQRLEDDAQRGRSPESIKAHLKSMRRLADQIENAGVMSYNEADELKDWVEDHLRAL